MRSFTHAQTIEAIALMTVNQHHKKDPKIKNNLVVVKKSLLEQWKPEVETRSELSAVIYLRGGK